VHYAALFCWVKQKESVVIDLETIQKVAKLSRLKLSEEEVVSFQKQLSLVLENFEKIAKVSTENVEPLVTPTDMEHILRKDEIDTHFDSEKALQNAPEKIGNMFKVPPVV
jgi:aspartyl-tRNA(Asn)/glutamyl-tRNA(Gln) amidotransferase subunit C